MIFIKIEKLRFRDVYYDVIKNSRSFENALYMLKEYLLIRILILKSIKKVF